MSKTVSIEFKPTYYEKVNAKKAVTALEKSMNEVLIDLDRTLRDKVPKKTGYLRDSHSYEIQSKGFIITGFVKNSAKYWVYVQFGTSKMDARPWVTESLEIVKVNTNLEKYFRHFLN